LNAKQTVVSIGAAALVAGVIALAAVGRLNWIIAVLTALYPFARLFLPRLLSRLRQHRQSKPASDSQHATTESQYFRMTLHHATGHMDGEVKLGPQKGRFLSELRLSDLVALFGEIQDYDSQRLLETYLDHHHPNWRRESGATGGQPSAGMTRGEALEALGLADGASHDEIVAAHRRLIQRLHPDRGGSTYLAALLNRAKDILLGG
jgi:hypothetical protein